jgi:hypothetical protein
LHSPHVVASLALLTEDVGTVSKYDLLSQSESSSSCFESSALLAAAVFRADDCCSHFRQLIPMLFSFSVFKVEIITPSKSFVSDESHQTFTYSEVVDSDRLKQLTCTDSHLMHACVCSEMQVCVLCHLSLPSMLKPLSLFLSLAFSRLECARFAVLSVVDPHVPSFSRALAVSAAATEVQPFHRGPPMRVVSVVRVTRCLQNFQHAADEVYRLARAHTNADQLFEFFPLHPFLRSIVSCQGAIDIFRAGFFRALYTHSKN